jgi:uncharacterized phage-associated protein
MAYIPRYATNVSKALEVILWIAGRRPGIDVYHLVKASFFADKFHVTHYGRPIVGDSYSAAPWGPLPQVVYNLIRRDPIEMIAIDSNGDVPFRVDNRHRVYADRDANVRLLSVTDVEALTEGLAHVQDKSFDELYNETHADKAYINAGGNLMDYRDFIPDDDEHRDEKAEAIEETAPFAVF